MFGLNQAELIPHSFDDSPYSPHFGLSHAQMNVAMSQVSCNLSAAAGPG